MIMGNSAFLKRDEPNNFSEMKFNKDNVFTKYTLYKTVGDIFCY